MNRFWKKFTNCLEIQRYQLTASIPEELRVVVGWVYSSAFWVDPAELQFVVSGKNCLRTILNSLFFKNGLVIKSEDTLQTPLEI